MATINDIKEQMSVVASVGDFTNAMQQIATIRMIRLRSKVANSRPFIEAAHKMLGELVLLREKLTIEEQIRLERKHAGGGLGGGNGKKAVIVVTSNQGLTGRYNIEIYQKVEKLLSQYEGNDFYIIGKKGQEFFNANRTFRVVEHFPYEVPDTFDIETLRRLIDLFDYYSQITIIYSHYVNSATRDVVALSVVTPTVAPSEAEAADPKTKKKDAVREPRFIYEPDIIELITGISKRLRGALFQQQIIDARLAQYSAQMIGMKTASDNAVTLLGDLRMEYNKQRRKMIDKKISEVFAGSALW